MAHIVEHHLDPCRCSYTAENSIGYGLSAAILDPDADMLTYLSLVISCLHPFGLLEVDITMNGIWSAVTSARVWSTLDEALFPLDQTEIRVRLHEEAAIPPWEILPYECMDDFCRDILPGCASRGLLSHRGCDQDENCCLHDTER